MAQNFLTRLIFPFLSCRFPRTLNSLRFPFCISFRFPLNFLPLQKYPTSYLMHMTLSTLCTYHFPSHVRHSCHLVYITLPKSCSPLRGLISVPVPSRMSWECSPFCRCRWGLKEGTKRHPHPVWSYSIGGRSPSLRT